MNPTRMSVADCHQPMKEKKEQCAVLAFAFHPSKLARMSIQRTGQIYSARSGLAQFVGGRASA